MIRTRDFAKIKFSNSVESLAIANDNCDMTAGLTIGDAVSEDVDIVSISSGEAKPVAVPKTEPKPSRKRERKPNITTTSVRKPRKWSTPLKGNFSKITDFFQVQKTKSDATVKKLDAKDSDKSHLEFGVAPLNDSDIEIIEDEGCKSAAAFMETEQPKEAIRVPNQLKRLNSKAMLKKLSVRVERMDMAPYLNGEVLPMDMRRRRISTEQSKLDGFIDVKPPVNVTYFNTYLRSMLPMPETSMVRIESVEMAQHKVKREPVVVSLPERGAENGDNDIKVDSATSAIVVESNQSDSGEAPADDGMIASRSTLELLHSSFLVDQVLNVAPIMSAHSDNSSKIIDVKQNNAGTPLTSRKIKQTSVTICKQKTKKKKTTTVPSYKIIDGTHLAVDAFRYGDIEGVQHYFLSHFHADHYIGLKKTFKRHLYLSNTTARLVHTFIKVEVEFMHPMELQTPIVVDGVEVTALDANHCPGAVMFLFKLTTGKCILHTGDFRASPDMEEYPEFWNNLIDCIYLDTTYLSKKYAFQSQIDSIAELKYECNAFLKKNAAIGKERCLIVCGAYKIGKEKVWISIADEFGFNVYIDKERRKAMECLNDASVLAKLTPNPNKANIHVLPLGNLNYQQMSQYLSHYNDVFTVLLAIRPSGWENKARKPKYTSNVSLLGVQYSEHSSYNELERFVKFLQPKAVVSTVPTSHGNLEKTTKVPEAWMNHTEVKPNRESHQPTIADIFRKRTHVADERLNIAGVGNAEMVSFNSGAPDSLLETARDNEKDAVCLENSDSNLPTVHDISSDID